VKISKISAVTLLVSDMKKSVDFYSKIPNFRVVYGGPDSQFTSFGISDIVDGGAESWKELSYLNLKLNGTNSTDFGRIIFYTDDVDALYAYMCEDKIISILGNIESKPHDASWGERYFHVIDPDGYKLSFATPISKK
jgi:catechol 2,3-dioxygenase-like lactoylglutathione lyase family enzyme